MNIEKELLDRVKVFEQIKNRLAEITKEIGAKTEEQRAIYNQGLEIKGAIDILVALQAKEKEDLAKSKTAQLTLPVGVAPVIPDAPQVIPNSAPQETVAAPAILEVK